MSQTNVRTEAPLHVGVTKAELVEYIDELGLAGPDGSVS